jgi:hypothetical protein
MSTNTTVVLIHYRHKLLELVHFLFNKDCDGWLNRPQQMAFAITLIWREL